MLVGFAVGVGVTVGADIAVAVLVHVGGSVAVGLGGSDEGVAVNAGVGPAVGVA